MKLTIEVDSLEDLVALLALVRDDQRFVAAVTPQLRRLDAATEALAAVLPSPSTPSP